jgi:hypothetical protein
MSPGHQASGLRELADGFVLGGVPRDLPADDDTEVEGSGREEVVVGLVGGTVELGYDLPGGRAALSVEPSLLLGGAVDTGEHEVLTRVGVTIRGPYHGPLLS